MALAYNIETVVSKLRKGECFLDNPSHLRETQTVVGNDPYGRMVMQEIPTDVLLNYYCGWLNATKCVHVKIGQDAETYYRVDNGVDKPQRVPVETYEKLMEFRLNMVIRKV